MELKEFKKARYVVPTIIMLTGIAYGEDLTIIIGSIILINGVVWFFSKIYESQMTHFGKKGSEPKNEKG